MDEWKTLADKEVWQCFWCKVTERIENMKDWMWEIIEAKCLPLVGEDD